MADSLIERVENAAERVCVISVLSDIQKMIVSSEMRQGSRRAILNSLLDHIKPSFLGLITENEFKQYFLTIFVISPIEDAIISIVQYMRAPSVELYKFHRLIFLLDAVEKHGIEHLVLDSISIADDDDLTTALYHELSRLLTQIPDLMYNLLGRSLNNWSNLNEQLETFLNDHYKYLLNAIEKSLLLAKHRIQESCDVNLKFMSAVLPAIFRGSSKYFNQFIYWMEQREESLIWERIGWRLFAADSDRFLLTEDIVFHVAIAATDGRSLFRLFGGEILHSRTVKRILFYKMLVIKVFSLEAMVPRKLAECLNVGCSYELQSNDGPWMSLYIETVLNVLRTWSDSVHLIHSTDEHRCYIDNALLWLIYCAKEKIQKKLGLVVNEFLVNGMHAHLSCSDVHRRYRGMYIAEVLTKCLSLGQLSFEYPDEAKKDIKDLESIIEDNLLTTEVARGNEEMSENSKDIDSVYQRESNNIICAEAVGSQLDSDDDEFPTYEIPASEKNLKTSKEGVEAEKSFRPPHYIRDCMEDLNEQENFAKFEAAFGTLNSLIRKRAVAYDEIASELIRRLIFLTDRYKTDRFQERRLEMVISCLVMSPQLVSVVVEIMFSRSCSMFGRYLILEAISKAASELSNGDFDENCNTKITSPRNDCIEKNWQSIITERVTAKTKYHGKRQKPVNKQRKNGFADYASSFFYPLTALEQYRGHLDLLHRDYSLLAKILLVMSNIIYCAENCLTTPRMAKVLSDYLLPLQRHPESVVRQSVLYGYCSICISLSSPVLLQFFGDDLRRWSQYALTVGDTDSSVICREMGSSLVSVIACKIKETEDEICF